MSNQRKNPRTGEWLPVDIYGEQHIIQYDVDANAYGFRLAETPYRASPSTIEVIENVTGGGPFTEITSRTQPAPGQFWVDYEADNFYGTGFIACSSADDGKLVYVNYQGLGSTVKIRKAQSAILYEKKFGGGGVATAGVNTRELNTIQNVFNYSWVSLDTATHIFTLKRGIYYVSFFTNAYAELTQAFQAQFYNVTTSNIDLYGSMGYSSEGEGVLNIPCTTEYKLNQYFLDIYFDVEESNQNNKGIAIGAFPSVHAGAIIQRLPYV